MNKTTYFFVLPISIKASDFNNLPFGRQIEYFRQIEAFKQTAKSVHICQKRRSTAAALKEFKDFKKPFKNGIIECWTWT